MTYLRYIFISLKDKKLLKSHKIVQIKVFLIYLLADRRIRIREAQIGTSVPEII
jgi:hypothetical protein